MFTHHRFPRVCVQEVFSVGEIEPVSAVKEPALVACQSLSDDTAII